MSQGTVELSSTKFMSQSRGRHSFFCDRRTTTRDVRHYQALAMEEGLLLLKLDVKKAKKPDMLDMVVKVLQLCTQPRKGLIQRVVEHELDMNGGVSGPSLIHEAAESYDLAKDEDIWDVARKRRSSTVLLNYDEIAAVEIDPSGRFSQLAAKVRMQTTNIGKVHLELTEQPDVSSAIELFSARLADVTNVNVALNPDTMMYS